MLAGISAPWAARQREFSPMNIPEILADTRLWFVVGLGNNPDRAAFGVSKFLQDHGKQIVPIYPRAEVVHGEQGFKTIADAAKVWGSPDVVDVFVRSSRAGEFADQALAVGAKVVWFQLGVIDDSAAERVNAAGATMVMDTCPVIEWPAGLAPSDI